ncbi:MAG: hypothetical protein KDA64_17330 [Rhodospirillaceae bacterium]|nr:hypothetical protein [Rhodospirillaceae bacterium]
MVVFLAAMIAGLAAYFFFINPAWPPDYIGNDTYSRMVRVVQLWTSGSWYDSHIDRIWPDGLTSHWTRPMDALIILVSLPIMLARPAAEALHLGGWFIGPVLQVATVVVIVAGLRGLLRSSELFFTAAAFVFVAPIYHNFFPGRPDHNSVFIFTIAVTIVCLAHLFIRGPERLRWAWLLGACLAFAVWANMSALLLAFAVPVVLGVRWLVSGGAWMRANLTVAAGAALGMAVALLLERPWPDPLTVVEFDRISVAHLAAFGAILAVWAAVASVQAVRPGWTAGIVGRVLVGAPLAALGAAALVTAFPQFLAANQGIAVDALYGRTRSAHIIEYTALFSAEDFTSPASVLAAIAREAIWLVYWVVGTAVLAVMAVGRREGRWLWLTLVALVAIHLQVTWPLSPAWVQSITALAVLGYGVLTGRIFERLGRLAMVPRVVSRAVVLGALIIGPVLLQAGTANRSVNVAMLDICNVDALADAIDRDLPPRPMLGIMAHADFGPHFLYRTAHAVYAIPNHRWQPGYTLTYEVMTARDMDEARRIVGDAHADILVVCNSGESFLTPDEGTPTLRQRLIDGDPPDWLEPMVLPPEAGADLHAYRVVEPPDGGGG